VRFYFDSDPEGLWLVGSDAGLTADRWGVRGARQPGELNEFGQPAVSSGLLPSLDLLRGTVTLTRWDEDALVQQSALMLLRPIED
jgi:hypothetical protein